jgi:hypothetical protein
MLAFRLSNSREKRIERKKGKRERDNSPCPTAIPHNSSLGQFPCITTLNPIITQGNQGALNTNNPKKLNWTSGCLRLQIYTKVLLRILPKNTTETNGARHSKVVMA